MSYVYNKHRHTHTHKRTRTLARSLYLAVSLKFETSVSSVLGVHVDRAQADRVPVHAGGTAPPQSFGLAALSFSSSPGLWGSLVIKHIVLV